MPEADVKVGVVIVTFNGWAMTRLCLEALRGSTRAPAWIVVVDNSSSDETVNALSAEFPEVHVLPQNRNTGYAEGNNIGIRYCLEQGADAVLIMNNDVIVGPNTVRRLTDALEDADVAAPRIVTPEPATGTPGNPLRYDWRRGVLVAVQVEPVSDGQPQPAEMVSGCCVLVSAETFEHVGYFDEDFFLYYEDVDFFTRCQHAGLKVVYAADAVVEHRERSSSGGTVAPLILYYNTRNRLHLASKYQAAGLRFWLYFGLTRLVRWCQYVARGQWSHARALLRGINDWRRGRLRRAQWSW
jgi:GT2 family glycosyltransferase